MLGGIARAGQVALIHAGSERRGRVVVDLAVALDVLDRRAAGIAADELVEVLDEVLDGLRVGLLAGGKRHQDRKSVV